jgi:hypothetical protein
MTPAAGQAGVIYLLHVDRPYKHARHYTTGLHPNLYRTYSRRRINSATAAPTPEVATAATNRIKHKRIVISSEDSPRATVLKPSAAEITTSRVSWDHVSDNPAGKSKSGNRRPTVCLTRCTRFTRGNPLPNVSGKRWSTTPETLSGYQCTM